MKNNEFWGFLFNPFTRIAGLQAFGIGLVFVLFTGIIGAYSHVCFDGAIDMHLVNEISIIQSFKYLFVDLIAIILVMSITGLIISKGFRFIDILGTMILAKAPLIILAIAGFFTVSPDINEIMKNPNVIFQSVSFISVMLLTFTVTIWTIALMYNALKISCDVKGSKLTVSFIAALFFAEIISKILIHLIP